MEQFLPLILEAAVTAGHEILRIYNDPSQDFGVQKKADNSPLTIADKASHRIIMDYLRRTDIPVLSEEGRHMPYDERGAWHRLWVVDPLDGTKEFINRNGEFTVNIALVEDGAPVLGVIYVPVTGQLYWGMSGERTGAWKALVADDACFDVPSLVASARKLPLPQACSRQDFVIVASRSHMSPETEAYVEEARSTHGQVTLVSSGSSIKICLVAEGAADAYPRFAPTMEWDTAAGDAIARGAGCMVTDQSTGAPLRYNKEDLLNPWFLVRR